MRWEEIALGEVMDVKHGFPFRGEHFADVGEYILLSPGNCYETGGLKLKGEKEKYYVGDVPEDYILSTGDMLVVMTDLVGTAPILGGSFLIPEDNRFLHNQRLGLVTVTAPLRIDRRFLYYLLNTREYRAQVRGSASGATVRHTSPCRIKECRVTVPIDVAYQQSVAAALSAYDDLIENNRRRMVLLEDATRQLYQEWFVRLRFPGREHTRIVGGVPNGWRRRDLGAIATFLSGGTPSKARADFWEGEIPWVSSGELTALRIDDASLHVTEEAVEAGSRLVPPRTILGVVRGMSLAKEFRLAMTSRTVCFNQDLKAIVAGPEVEADYLFHALVAQRDTIRDRAGEASHGTKKLDTPVLASTPILVPPPSLQRAFADVVDPMNRLWDNLNRQNRQLRTARDLLLPRLMRGELLP